MDRAKQLKRKQLKELKCLIREAERLKERIENMPIEFEGYVADSVKDYRTGYPKNIVIEGYSAKKYYKIKRKLRNKLKLIQSEIKEIENWIDNLQDKQVGEILRMQYIEGVTQKEIADNLGYSRSAIAMKLQRFWETES